VLRRYCHEEVQSAASKQETLMTKEHALLFLTGVVLISATGVNGYIFKHFTVLQNILLN
jgi:hypothetical protein